MITFDPNTSKQFNTQKEDIFVSVIQDGCSGNSLRIGKYEKYENSEFEKIASNLDKSVQVFSLPKHKKLLENSRITKVGQKWILKSENILSRCGCAKSFSVKSENERDNKIALLREKLRKAKKKCD